MAIGNQHVEKTYPLAVIWKDLDWKALRDARLILALGPEAGLGLVTLYHDEWTLAFGVARSEHDVYLPWGPPNDGKCHPHCRKGTGTHCFDGWIWGAATEAYDHCLDYFGLGPVLFACWEGGTEPPRPVRALGRALKATAASKAMLQLILRAPVGRPSAWVSRLLRTLERQGDALDP